MGRSGITYDQVAAVADVLQLETGRATQKDVLERLGTGGMGTIHRHLTTWSANRPKESAPAVELPADIGRALGAWVTQATTAARAATEERLVQAQVAAAELAKNGELLEAKLDATQERMAALTTERDQEQATARARAAEIERLASDIERERALAGAAQIDAAKAQLKAESQTEQLGELKFDAGRVNAALKAEAQARADAEKKAAVLQSERDAARIDVTAGRERIQDLQAAIDKTNQHVAALRAELEKEIKAERTEAATERAEKLSALIENAGLKAQLAAADKTIAPAGLKNKGGLNG